MNGKTSKFYKFKNTSGRVNIPISITESLNWNHKDEIKIIVQNIDGKIGLFIFKE